MRLAHPASTTMDFENLDFIPDVLQPWMPLIVGIVTAAVILILGIILAGWMKSLVAKLLRKRKVEESLVRFLAALTRWLVIAAAVITALERVGLQTTSLVALLGSAGIAIGLALQGNLSHFASGVMILMFRPFKVGDYIEAAGREGHVEHIGLFTSKLITLDTEEVIIPNGQVTSGVVINYSSQGKRRARIAIGVAYGSKLSEVIPALRKAAESSDLVIDEPAPVIAFDGFGASSLDFLVMPHSKPEDFIPMLHDVRTRIYEELEAADIEIPFAQIVVHEADAS